MEGQKREAKILVFLLGVFGVFIVLFFLFAVKNACKKQEEVKSLVIHDWATQKCYQPYK